MKLVINKCFGGFGLSDAACEALVKHGVPLVPFINERRDPETNRYLPEPRNEGRLVIDYEHPEVDWAGDDKAKEMHDRWQGTRLRSRYSAAWFREDENRGDPALVAVVEELGEAASGPLAKLKVVEIPDGVDWFIDDYDGRESVAEKHRSWS